MEKIDIVNPVAVAPSPPERVWRTKEQLAALGIWHAISTNSPATSCRDAAHRRYRLGNVGIPLNDELKSLHMIGRFPDGQTRHVLIHARANCRFNLETAQLAVGAVAPMERLDKETLAESYGARYGTVNPFSEAHQFIQVFDRGLLDRYPAPHTMMTNAGDLEWAVEFYPAEVIEILRNVSPQVIVADIVHHRRERRNNLPVFGILTGNGPESGQSLWRQLNGHIHQELMKQKLMYGDLSYPRVIVDSIPEMGLSMELKERLQPVREVVCGGVENLLHAGATHIAIACNTTPYYEKDLQEICAKHGGRFISVVEAVLQYLEKHNLTNLTLMAIPRVANMGEFSAFAPLKDLGVVPMAQRAECYLQELGYLVKRMEPENKGVKELNTLTHAIRSGVDTDHVLIALTEISVLLERFDSKIRRNRAGKNIIDSLEIYAKYLADIYLDALAQEDDPTMDSWE